LHLPADFASSHHVDFNFRTRGKHFLHTHSQPYVSRPYQYQCSCSTADYSDVNFVSLRTKVLDSRPSINTFVCDLSEQIWI